MTLKNSYCSNFCVFKIVCTISVIGLVSIFQFTNVYHKHYGMYHKQVDTTIKEEIDRDVQYSLPSSGTMTSVESALASDSAVPTNPVVIFSVLPKCGSRTLFALMGILGEKHGFDVKHTMGGDDETAEDKVKIIRQTLLSKNPAFIYTHRRYQAFGRERKPVYISIVRDPVERLASLYYFMRYGDNRTNVDLPAVQFRAKMDARNYSNNSFNDCVLNGNKMCRRVGSVVRQFCGYIGCTDSTATQAPIKKAIAHIDRSYHVVGIMEDYKSILRVLEKKIPQLFQGIVALYEEQKKEIVSNMRTKNKTKITPKVRNILKKELAEDYKLYNLIKEKFDISKKKLSIE